MAHRCRILLVEDDDDLRAAVACALGLVGYAVTTACDGREALEVLGRGLLPCVILLDWAMPRMDGAAFRAAQSADRRLAEVPVILCSADRRAEAAGRDMRVSRVVQKPLDLETLRGAIAGQCRLQQVGA